ALSLHDALPIFLNRFAVELVDGLALKIELQFGDAIVKQGDADGLAGIAHGFSPLVCGCRPRKTRPVAVWNSFRSDCYGPAAAENREGASVRSPRARDRCRKNGPQVPARRRPHE